MADLGSPLPSSPYGLSGRKATLNLNLHVFDTELQELCESQGGRPGLPVPNGPCGLCGRKATLNLNLHVFDTELRSSVKVEIAVLGSPSLIVLMVSVDVKQH